MKDNTTDRLIIPISDAVYDAIKQAQDIEQRRRTGAKPAGLMLGYPALDAALGGLQHKDLCVIAADTGVGKSAFATNIIINNLDAKTLMVSLEMSSTQISNRMLCMLSREKMSDIKAGTIQRWDRISAAQDKLDGRPIAIMDRGDVTIETIKAAIKEYEDTYGAKPELIIVDYLQLMSAKGIRSSDTRERVVATITRLLKQLATEEKIVVIALSQTNKDASKRKDDPVPRLTDLRESGAIAQDANEVLMLWEDSVSDPDSEYRLLSCIVAKAREGRRGIVQQLAFHAPTQRMLAPGVREEPTQYIQDTWNQKEVYNHEKL